MEPGPRRFVGGRIGSPSAPSGGCAAVVVYFERQVREGIEDPEERVAIRRRGTPRAGCERRLLKRTYGEGKRYIRKKKSEGGWRVESWGLGGCPSAFDTEVAALVRALELCALDTTAGAEFRSLRTHRRL